jgi:multidrug resistance efflux pump
MKRIMLGAVAVIGVAVSAAWIARSQQASNGATPVSQSSGPQSSGPLIARGYTEAPAGTVTVANDPNGGSVIRELRIKDGQTVKKDEIIAVMANYPGAEVGVGMSRNNLKSAEKIRDENLKGTRVIDLALQEDALKSAILSKKLGDLQRARSSGPPDQREIEAWQAEKSVESQRDSLELSKARLANDLIQNELDIQKLKASLDSAIRIREEALVRSPVDGVVTQILSRQGEMASGVGIAKIVDMTQLRVFATVDELHLHRLKPGAPVEITFRGSPTVYKGKVALEPLSVKREKRSEADLGVSNVRQIEVEIKADDGVTFPQMLGREARVIFL